MKFFTNLKKRLSANQPVKPAQNEEVNPFHGMKTVAVDAAFKPIVDFTKKLEPQDIHICDDIYPATLMVVCKEGGTV